MNHYWVRTPMVDCHYQYEPPEEFEIFECVEAKNKSDAKNEFVKVQRSKWVRFSMNCSNWFYHLGKDENPYKDLTVESCMCEHGVCNCDRDDCTIGKPKDPYWDYCGECIKAEEERDSDEKEAEEVSIGLA